MISKRFVYTAVAAAALTVVFGGRLAMPVLAQTVKAVLMRDTDNPALHPAQHGANIVLNQGTGSSPESDPYYVPAGYRLVIDSVSVRAIVPNGQSVHVSLSSHLSGSSSVNTWVMPPVPMAWGTTESITETTVQTTQFADPGTQVQFLAQRLGSGSSTGTQDIVLRWSGHLVSLN